jgi:hypothetical protein
MCDNKFSIYDPLPQKIDLFLEPITMKRHDFTCDQVKSLRNEWVSDYAKANRCRPNDRRLSEYTEEIDQFIGRCKDACTN